MIQMDPVLQMKQERSLISQKLMIWPDRHF